MHVPAVHLFGCPCCQALPCQTAAGIPALARPQIRDAGAEAALEIELLVQKWVKFAGVLKGALCWLQRHLKP